MSAYTPVELQARLSQVADDPAWSGPLRVFARNASCNSPGFAVEPADLSDEALRTALVEAVVDRKARPAVTDTAGALNARIDALGGPR